MRIWSIMKKKSVICWSWIKMINCTMTMKWMLLSVCNIPKKGNQYNRKNYRWTWVSLITLKTHVLWQGWQCYKSYWDYYLDRPTHSPLKKFPRLWQFKERRKRKEKNPPPWFSEVNCGLPGLKSSSAPCTEQQQQGGQECTVTSSDIPTCIIPSHACVQRNCYYCRWENWVIG